MGATESMDEGTMIMIGMLTEPITTIAEDVKIALTKKTKPEKVLDDFSSSRYLTYKKGKIVNFNDKRMRGKGMCEDSIIIFHERKRVDVYRYGDKEAKKLVVGSVEWQNLDHNVLSPNYIAFEDYNGSDSLMEFKIVRVSDGKQLHPPKEIAGNYISNLRYIGNDVFAIVTVEKKKSPIKITFYDLKTNLPIAKTDVPSTIAQPDNFGCRIYKKKNPDTIGFIFVDGNNGLSVGSINLKSGKYLVTDKNGAFPVFWNDDRKKIIESNKYIAIYHSYDVHIIDKETGKIFTMKRVINNDNCYLFFVNESCFLVEGYDNHVLVSYEKRSVLWKKIDGSGDGQTDRSISLTLKLASDNFLVFTRFETNQILVLDVNRLKNDLIEVRDSPENKQKGKKKQRKKKKEIVKSLRPHYDAIYLNQTQCLVWRYDEGTINLVDFTLMQITPLLKWKKKRFNCEWIERFNEDSFVVEEILADYETHRCLLFRANRFKEAKVYITMCWIKKGLLVDILRYVIMGYLSPSVTFGKDKKWAKVLHKQIPYFKNQPTIDKKVG